MSTNGWRKGFYKEKDWKKVRGELCEDKRSDGLFSVVDGEYIDDIKEVGTWVNSDGAMISMVG